MKATILVIALYLLALIGYVRCWYQFCTSDFEPSYKREVIYAIGCFTGTGIVIGFFNISDKPE